jgi:hypothetical protein
VFILCAGQGDVVLRGLVPRIHVFLVGVKAVDGRVKPGQDEDERANSSTFATEKFSPDSPARKRESIYVSGLWIPALRFAMAGMTSFEVVRRFLASCKMWLPILRLFQVRSEGARLCCHVVSVA